MWSNPLASRIFPLPRVTRIFQKNVFTKAAPVGPRRHAAQGFLLRGRRAFPRRDEEMRRSGPAPEQPMDAGNRGRLQAIVWGLFFTMNTATSTCPRRSGLEPRAIAGYGANSTWRHAAGRSPILSPGLGFDGGDGLGWSTASVN